VFAVHVHAADVGGLAALTARVDLPGQYLELPCEPPAGPDSVCTLSPRDLGLALAAGDETAGEISVIARDAAGNEVAESRTLTFRSRLVWTLDPIAGEISVTPAAQPDAVIVGTENGAVIRVDAAGTETHRWQNPTQDDPVTTPIGSSKSGDRVFFGTSRSLVCLDASNLSPCWTSMPNGTFLSSTPVHSASNNTVMVGRYGTTTAYGTLSAYDARDGSLLGTFPITDEVGGGVTAPPALSADGRTVYIGSTDGDMWAIDVSTPSNMQRLWVQPFTARIGTLPLVTSSRIYVAGFDGYLHALDTVSGSLDHSFSFMREYPFLASVAAAPDGTLYVANLDEKLYALDAGGAELGSYEIGRSVTSAVVGDGGIVYATSAIGPSPDYGPGQLYAFDSALSELLWTFVPGSGLEFRASPVMITAPDGRPLVIVANTNGRLYAFDATPPVGR